MMRVLVLCLTMWLTAGSLTEGLASELSPPVAELASAAQDSLPIPPAGPDKKKLKSDIELLAGNKVPGSQQWEQQKSARVAIVSSMVVPGLGQLYNGRRIKTLIMVGVFTSYATLMWLERKDALRAEVERDKFEQGSIDWKFQNALYEFHKANSTDYMWWSGLVWLIGVLDAFVDAHLYDVRTVDPTVIEGAHRQRYLGVNVRF